MYSCCLQAAAGIIPSDQSSANATRASWAPPSHANAAAPLDPVPAVQHPVLTQRSSLPGRDHRPSAPVLHRPFRAPAHNMAVHPEARASVIDLTQSDDHASPSSSAESDVMVISDPALPSQQHAAHHSTSQSEAVQLSSPQPSAVQLASPQPSAAAEQQSTSRSEGRQEAQLQSAAPPMGFTSPPEDRQIARGHAGPPALLAEASGQPVTPATAQDQHSMLSHAREPRQAQADSHRNGGVPRTRRSRWDITRDDIAAARRGPSITAAEPTEGTLQQTASSAVDSTLQQDDHEQHQDSRNDVAHGQNPSCRQPQAASQQHHERQHYRQLTVEPSTDPKHRHSHHTRHRQRHRSRSISRSMSRSHRRAERRHAEYRARNLEHDGMPGVQREASVQQDGAFQLSEGQDRWQMWQPEP